MRSSLCEIILHLDIVICLLFNILLLHGWLLRSLYSFRVFPMVFVCRVTATLTFNNGVIRTTPLLSCLVSN